MHIGVTLPGRHWIPPTPHERLCESPNMPAEMRYTQQSLLFARRESTRTVYKVHAAGGVIKMHARAAGSSRSYFAAPILIVFYPRALQPRVEASTGSRRRIRPTAR